MRVSVKWVLLSLNLDSFTHISIRRHLERGIDYLGGGKVSAVLSRFGSEIVVDSCIVDSILVIYVE